jgi:hypothetical protein
VHPGEITEQPATGFHVASVHSIELSAMTHESPIRILSAFRIACDAVNTGRPSGALSRSVAAIRLIWSGPLMSLPWLMHPGHAPDVRLMRRSTAAVVFGTW